MDSSKIGKLRRCLALALENGAESARAALTVSTDDIVSTLNGETDKVSHCGESSISISIFADGRFGSFSTNKLDDASLVKFISDAVKATRMLTADPFRRLPDPGRCCRDAKGGELGLFDAARAQISPDQRIRRAMDASVFRDCPVDLKGFEFVSEEGEYSDSVYESVTMDTNGLECRHIETGFDYCAEITVADRKGRKYSSYWWDSSTRDGVIDGRKCGATALQNAMAQAGAEPVAGGRRKLVVDSRCASKLVSPILNALNGYQLQQHNSFLDGSLGKQVFPEGLTIRDLPHIKGESGSRLYDSEGVATIESDIISKGVVKQYFLNTYMSGKMNMPATAEEASRPCVMPWPSEGLGRDNILGLCGDGILVTEFNGGNCNPATGDFSYGIEGFTFSGGKIGKPVSGMVITGNFISLWKSLIACGSDARRCCIKLVPTLAFAGVDFSGE